MSNLDPPRDRLEVWEQYGNVRVGQRVPGGCDYVLATLTHAQAADLGVALVLHAGVPRSLPVGRYSIVALPLDCQPKGDPMPQTIEKTGTTEEREGFEPSPASPPNPAPAADLAAAPSTRSVDIANALPWRAGAGGIFPAGKPELCHCGALYRDHLSPTPISGYCILLKNARTAKLPGVQRITAVKL